MKRFTTQLTALALLLAGGSQCAWAEDTVTDYEVLDNYSSITFLYDDSTDTDTNIGVANNATYFYKNTNKYTSGGNNAVQFHFSSAVDVSNYDYLVIETEEAMDNCHFEPCLSPATDASYWGAGNNTFGKLTGGDYYVFNLETYKDTIGGSKVVGTVVLLFNAGTKGDTITFKSIKFTNTYEEDKFYLEVDYSASECSSGSATSEDSMAINFTSNSDEWSYTLPDSAKNYEYMVVVPRKMWLASDDNNKVTVENDPEVTYTLSDGINSITATLAWYGTSRRAWCFNVADGITYSSASDEDTYQALADSLQEAVWDSTTIKGYYGSYVNSGSSNRQKAGNTWKTLKVKVSSAETFEISAIYFSNTQCEYHNQWNYSSLAGDYIIKDSVAGTYGTVCLPYASAVCGARIYDVVGYGKDEKGNPSKLYLEEVKGVLTAGKAYIYQTLMNTIITTDIDNYAQGYVTFLKAGGENGGYSNSKDALKGNTSSSSVEVEADKYILQLSTTDNDSTYYWETTSEGATSSNSVTQYHAYLDLSVYDEEDATTESEAAKKGWISMSIAYDGDDTTGIKEIETEEQDATDDDIIYNLSGVRVTNPQKGIYIKNGKKYIIK